MIFGLHIFNTFYSIYKKQNEISHRISPVHHLWKSILDLLSDEAYLTLRVDVAVCTLTTRKALLPFEANLSGRCVNQVGVV